MNTITSWAFAVCTVAVICTLYDMIVPQGNTSKMLNFVLGMFLVVAVLIPLVNIIKSDSFDFTDIEYNSTEFALPEENNKLTIDIGKSTVEKIISDTLQENEIKYKSIAIDMDSSNGYSIDIIRVKIFVGAEYRNSLVNVQNIVKEKTGITPEVIVG